MAKFLFVFVAACLAQGFISSAQLSAAPNRFNPRFNIIPPILKQIESSTVNLVERVLNVILSISSGITNFLLGGIFPNDSKTLDLKNVANDLRVFIVNRQETIKQAVLDADLQSQKTLTASDDKLSAASKSAYDKINAVNAPAGSDVDICLKNLKNTIDINQQSEMTKSLKCVELKLKEINDVVAPLENSITSKFNTINSRYIGCKIRLGLNCNPEVIANLKSAKTDIGLLYENVITDIQRKTNELSLCEATVPADLSSNAVQAEIDKCTRKP